MVHIDCLEIYYDILKVNAIFKENFNITRWSKSNATSPILLGTIFRWPLPSIAIAARWKNKTFYGEWKIVLKGIKYQHSMDVVLLYALTRIVFFRRKICNVK